MKDKLDFQLGRVTDINKDGTINILNFRTGGTVYKNVDIEHLASDQYQPKKGDHVLFFTVPSPLSTRIVKVVKFFGSINTNDRFLVKSSPIDLDYGERRMTSLKGNTVYVANGAVSLNSLGQFLILNDSPQISQLRANHIQIVSNDGTVIEEKGGTLTLKKGEITVTDTNGPEVQITDPKITVQITGDTVTVSGKGITVNLNCERIILGSDTQKAIMGETFLSLYNSHTHATGMGPTGTPITQLNAETVLTKKTTIS